LGSLILWFVGIGIGTLAAFYLLHWYPSPLKVTMGRRGPPRLPR